MKSSRIKELHRLSIGDRIDILRDRGFLDPESARSLARGEALLPQQIADRMIENVIGVFGLPFGIAPNFVVNEKDYLVPMVVEETSVVASLAKMAKWVSQQGGVITQSGQHEVQGQIHLPELQDQALVLSCQK